MLSSNHWKESIDRLTAKRVSCCGGPAWLRLRSAVCAAAAVFSIQAVQCQIIPKRLDAVNHIVPAIIDLDVVRDDTTVVATTKIQPLDQGEWIVVANRMYFHAYHPWDGFVIAKGMHSPIVCYDSITNLGAGWYEPMDYVFSTTESFVLCEVSNQQPLTLTHTRYYDASSDPEESSRM